MLDTHKLDARASCFKLTMTNNVNWALEQPILDNLLSKLCKKVNVYHIIVDRCYVYLKVANIEIGGFLVALGMIKHSPP